MSLNSYVHNSQQLNVTLRNALVSYRNVLRENLENVLPHVPYDPTEKVQVTAKVTEELQTVIVELEKVSSVLREKRVDVPTVKTSSSFTFEIL